MDIYIKKLLLNFEIDKCKFYSVHEKEKIKNIINEITYSEINKLLDEALQNFIKNNSISNNLLEIKKPISIHIDFNISKKNLEGIKELIESQLSKEITKNINIYSDNNIWLGNVNNNKSNIFYLRKFLFLLLKSILVYINDFLFQFRINVLLHV